MDLEHGNTDRLARAARDGDPNRFAAAWERGAPSVFAWATLHIRSPLRRRLGPEDVVQEVACRAWSSFGRWDEKEGPFRGWVFGIANNVLREFLRRMASERPPSSDPDASGLFHDTDRWQEVPDTATAISQAVVKDETLQAMLDHVDALPQEDRQLLILRGLEGLSHEEVAVILSASSDAVAKRWQRLRDRLRAQPRWADLIVD